MSGRNDEFWIVNEGIKEKRVRDGEIVPNKRERQRCKLVPLFLREQ
jgi:hypothetical protein